LLVIVIAIWSVVVAKFVNSRFMSDIGELKFKKSFKASAPVHHMIHSQKIDSVPSLKIMPLAEAEEKSHAEAMPAYASAMVYESKPTEKSVSEISRAKVEAPSNLPIGSGISIAGMRVDNFYESESDERTSMDDDKNFEKDNRELFIDGLAHKNTTEVMAILDTTQGDPNFMIDVIEKIDDIYRSRKRGESSGNLPHIDWRDDQFEAVLEIFFDAISMKYKSMKIAQKMAVIRAIKVL